MAMWLQKVVLTVVAVVPVIVGEIVRATDDAPAENVVLLAPCPHFDRDPLAPDAMPISPLPYLELERATDGTVSRHGG